MVYRIQEKDKIYKRLWGHLSQYKVKTYLRLSNPDKSILYKTGNIIFEVAEWITLKNLEISYKLNAIKKVK